MAQQCIVNVRSNRDSQLWTIQAHTKLKNMGTMQHPTNVETLITLFTSQCPHSPRLPLPSLASPLSGDYLSVAYVFLTFSPFSAGREVGLGPDSPTPPVVLLGSAVISVKAYFLSYCFDRLGFHRESSIFCQDSGQRQELRSLLTWA